MPRTMIGIILVILAISIFGCAKPNLNEDDKWLAQGRKDVQELRALKVKGLRTF